MGGFNSKKSLKGLVVRKKATTTVTSKPSDNQSENSNNSEHKNSQETEKKVALPTWQKISQTQSNGEPVTVNGTVTALKNSDVSATNTIVKPSGLGLLGNYSDSDSSNESN